VLASSAILAILSASGVAILTRHASLAAGIAILGEVLGRAGGTLCLTILRVLARNTLLALNRSGKVGVVATRTLQALPKALG
jgi:hypothetical protein